MQPYIKAMTWAFWRERRIHFISFIILASAFSVFIRQFIPIFEKYESMQIIFIFAIFFEIASLGMLIISGFGSSVMNLKIPDQLYVKPVSSRFLLSIYFGLSILSIIAIHLIAVLLYRFVGHLDWPLFIPLICLISIILCAYALFWSFSDTPLLCSISIALVCGSMAFIFIEFIIKRHVSLQYFLCNIMSFLLIVDTFALLISFKAIKHARYGEKIRSARFWELIYLRLKDLLPGKNWNLNTPQKAYFWLIFRSGGIIIPELNLVFILISFLIFIFMPAAEKSREVFGCIQVFGFINLFMLPFIGAFLSHQEDKSFGVSYQIATRPISERSILTALLKVFAACYLISWIIYFIGFSIILSLLKATGHLETTGDILTDINHIKTFFSFPRLLLYPLGIWAAVGLFGSILMTGRKWVLLAFFSILLIIPISIILTNAFGSEAFNQILKSLSIWTLAIGSFCGTILAMIHAIRKFLISFRFVKILISVYISFCIIGLILNFSYAENPVNAIILCTMLTLPFAPFATAPLALYWNRHR